MNSTYLEVYAFPLYSLGPLEGSLKAKVLKPCIKRYGPFDLEEKRDAFLDFLRQNNFFQFGDHKFFTRVTTFIPRYGNIARAEMFPQFMAGRGCDC